MKRLGYTPYVAQSGDRGALITEQMGVLASPQLLGIHIKLPSAVPAGLWADEPAAFDRLALLLHPRLVLCPTDGESPADALRDCDSPVQLAAWFIDHDSRGDQL